MNPQNPVSSADEPHPSGWDNRAMMTCRDIDRFLMDYLDGKLPLLTRAQFATHLALCGTCRRYLRQYRQTIAMGKAAFANPDAPPETVPEDLVAAILNSAKKSDE
ncbi:MAG: zf-HC2 domain-containing protein [Tepidisphaeraceae bacterium]